MNYQFNNRLHTSPSSGNQSELRPRFQRNSPSSSRTSPSRSSQDSPVHQKFIKFTKISKAKLDPDDFFQGFSEQFVRPPTQQKLIPKHTTRKQNNLVKIKSLEKQLAEREIQLEDMRVENQRLKKALDREIEKRRNAEKSVKNTILNLSELQRKVRQYEQSITNLSKQIRYYEESVYGKEDRILFTFREKGIIEQIKRIKTNLATSFLSEQIKRLSQQNQQLKQQNRHLRIAQGTIIHRLVHFQKQLKVAIKIQEQFFDLRQKYEQLARKERKARKQLEKLRLNTNQSQISLSYSNSNKSTSERKMTLYQSVCHTRKRPNGS